ncbi:MAG: GAF domain-containing protein [Marinobacter sp.]
MQTPDHPANEDKRLSALEATLLLDTPPEERFDRITRLAARLFNVPICLVSLIDVNRQWFKSRFGLGVRETARDISFCGHAILGADTFVVENALQDQRFADNPLVTGEPNIRFYAGAPLEDHHGHRLGTLCLIDRSPRLFSDDDKQALRDLADIVEREFQYRELGAYYAERTRALNILNDITMDTNGPVSDRIEQERLASSTHDRIAPVPGVFFQTISIDRNVLFRIKVLPGPNKPYYLKSKGPEKGTYIRVGSTNRLADEWVLTDLRRQGQNRSLDEEVETRFGCEVFSSQVLSRYTQWKGLQAQADLEYLVKEKLAVRYNGSCYPTVGGLLLFSDILPEP